MPDVPESISQRKKESQENAFLAALTKESIAHPDRNEDAYVADTDHEVFAVLDGIGGHARGEVPSHLAAAFIQDIAATFSDASVEEAGRQLAHALIAANELIKMVQYDELPQIVSRNLDTPEGQEEVRHALKKAYEKSSEIDLILAGKKSPREPIQDRKKNMGSTVVLTKIIKAPEGKRQAVIAHVGDSRAYILRKNGILQHCTLDDGYMPPGYPPEKAGELQVKLSNIETGDDLDTMEEMAYANRNQITQALGAVTVLKPQVNVFDLEEGDELLLTSDGIHDNLTSNEMNAELRIHRGEEGAHGLLQKAYERAEKRHQARRDPDAEIQYDMRAKPDDMTIIRYCPAPERSDVHAAEHPSSPPNEFVVNPTEKKVKESIQAIRRAQSFNELYEILRHRESFPLWDAETKTYKDRPSEYVISRIMNVNRGNLAPTFENILHPALQQQVKKIIEISALRAQIEKL